MSGARHSGRAANMLSRNLRLASLLMRISTARPVRPRRWFLNGRHYVARNHSAHHLDFDPRRRPPDLALQFRLGLLSRGRARSCAHHPSHSRAARKVVGPRTARGPLARDANAISSPPDRPGLATLVRTGGRFCKHQTGVSSERCDPHGHNERSRCDADTAIQEEGAMPPARCSRGSAASSKASS
jgi:hypothetical protein